MYEAILFDLDGTLADSIDAHVAAWKKAMEELGKPPGEREVSLYRRLVGKRLKDILETIYGKMGEKEYRAIKEAKERYFREKFYRLVKPKVARSILKVLKGRYKLAVVTSTTREMAHFLLDHIGLRDLFDVVVTAEDVKRGKPEPEGILRALEQLGTRKALYVGDTEYDRMAAEKAGVDYMDVEEFLRTWRSLL